MEVDPRLTPKLRIEIPEMTSLVDEPTLSGRGAHYFSKRLQSMQIRRQLSGSFRQSRRHFLTNLSAGVAAGSALWFDTPGAFAEELMRTQSQTPGPFYPTSLPLDTDNDLLVINDTITPAIGEVTHLTGRLTDTKGRPIRNAVVEIWQCDSSGAYLHEKSANFAKRDKNFQSFGRFLTGSTGEYYFRTIKPVAYPGRTPHIHFAVKRKGQPRFTTQCYVQGNPGNQRDVLWKRIPTDRARQSVTVEFAKMQDSAIGELAAKFDIVLGKTPNA